MEGRQREMKRTGVLDSSTRERIRSDTPPPTALAAVPKIIGLFGEQRRKLARTFSRIRSRNPPTTDLASPLQVTRGEREAAESVVEVERARE